VGVKIAVIGGGLSGLCVSHHLVQAGHDVTCFEASDRPGGLIRSEKRDGFLCEVGPQAILDGSPDVKALFADLGLQARVCTPAPAARRRMVYVGGKLRTVPGGPGSFLVSDILSLGGKWRLFRESSVKEKAAVEDETVLEFAARRGGREAAERLVAPAVIGVFSGDAAKLSMRAAFPRLAVLEARYGSLIKGMKAARKRGVKAGRSVSFPDGLEELPRALAEGLSGRLVTLKVSAIKRDLAGWIVERERFDGVIVATSPLAAAPLIESAVPAAAAGLRALTMASVAVVGLGFRRRELGMDLDAYGFLVARGERPTILGCQYDSTVFPGRAPEGGAFLRVIVGGTFEPAAVERDDAALVAQALGDLRTITGLAANPDFTVVWRHRQVLPQYEVGHERRADAIESAMAKNLRLHLLTIGLGGVGLSDCIRNAAALARRIGPA
jgi:oxygen-dependent protoporphyrinogen oxidase